MRLAPGPAVPPLPTTGERHRVGRGATGPDHDHARGTADHAPDEHPGSADRPTGGATLGAGGAAADGTRPLHRLPPARDCCREIEPLEGELGVQPKRGQTLLREAVERQLRHVPASEREPAPLARDLQEEAAAAAKIEHGAGRRRERRERVEQARSLTAAGGAWNASIVAEVVTWGDVTLEARGLGAYITSATATGDWPRIVLGVGIMGAYVVGLNRLVWRPLERLAVTRYSLAA